MGLRTRVCVSCLAERPYQAFRGKSNTTCYYCVTVGHVPTKREKTERARQQALTHTGGRNVVYIPPKTAAGLCIVAGCEERGIGRPIRYRIGGRLTDVLYCREDGKKIIGHNWGALHTPAPKKEAA
jgi:hypothetical protein